jgi:hypothetical protein
VKIAVAILFWKKRQMTNESILDEPFSPCAFAAMVIEARKVGCWPDSEKVRRLAYELFEKRADR